jgi:hypothetical protein
MRRRTLPLVAAALAIGAAGGIAQAAAGPEPTIAACAETSSGVLRLVTPERPCDPARGALVEWNQAGPPGAAGPEGPRGAGLVRDVRFEELVAGRRKVAALVQATPTKLLTFEPEDKTAEAFSVRRAAQVALPDDYAESATVVGLALPKGRWVITGKTTATVSDTLDYLGQSKGSAYCTLVAGDDRDAASAHRSSLGLMVTHRYARRGTAEIRCVGTPDTIVMQTAVTAVRVGKLTKLEG